jgi:hypothetical protein
MRDKVAPAVHEDRLMQKLFPYTGFTGSSFSMGRQYVFYEVGPKFSNTL